MSQLLLLLRWPLCVFGRHVWVASLLYDNEDFSVHQRQCRVCGRFDLVASP